MNLVKFEEINKYFVISHIVYFDNTRQNIFRLLFGEYSSNARVLIYSGMELRSPTFYCESPTTNPIHM